MKRYGKLLLAGLLLALFAALIVFLRRVDVAAIGPAGTSIGFSRINQAVHERLGVHMTWYKLTEALGALSIVVAAYFALVGLVQMIQRRSLLAVDRSILALGGLYIAMLLVYVLFEKLVVNYRPILEAGQTMPEASFPSSHTMLTAVILGSAAMVARRSIENGAVRRIIAALCAVLIAAAVLGRLICGVHWLTDILGGVLISAALLSLYSFAAGEPEDEEE